MKYAPIVIIPSQAAASVNGVAIPAQDLLYVSAQMTTTGSSAGTLKMQASNDNVVIGNGITPVNWTDVSGATVSVSGAGSVLLAVQTLCYQWIRFVYTNSGTGNISAVAKVIGF